MWFQARATAHSDALIGFEMAAKEIPGYALSSRVQGLLADVRTKSLWVAHHSDRDVWVGDVRGPTCVVHHVQNASGASRGQADGQQVVEASRRKGGRNLKRVRGVDVHALIEEALASHPVAAEAGHIVVYLEGGPAVDARSLHPSR